MPRHATIADLRSLRRVRAVRERDLGLEGVLDAQMKSLKRRVRSAGGLGRAWAEVVPRALAVRAEPERLAAGVLTIRAADAAARFELDAWLRGGGALALKRATPATIRKIKIV